MSRDIRAVVASDVVRLCDLQSAAWREEYPHVVDPEQWLDADGFTREAREANMVRLITAESTECFLAAVQDDAILGFITVGASRDADRPGETELGWIYFDPSAHGTGFALELAEAALGKRAAYLWVAERNPRARAFYAKLGFAPDGARRDAGTLFDEPELRYARLHLR